MSKMPASLFPWWRNYAVWMRECTYRFPDIFIAWMNHSLFKPCIGPLSKLLPHFSSLPFLFPTHPSINLFICSPSSTVVVMYCFIPFLYPQWEPKTSFSTPAFYPHSNSAKWAKCTKSPSRLPRQNGNSNLCLQDPNWYSNPCITLAFRGWLPRNSSKH